MPAVYGISFICFKASGIQITPGWTPSKMCQHRRVLSCETVNTKRQVAINKQTTVMRHLIRQQTSQQMDKNQNLWPCPHKASKRKGTGREIAKDKMAVKYQGWAATNTQTRIQIQNMENQTGKQRWPNARLRPNIGRNGRKMPPNFRTNS